MINALIYDCEIVRCIPWGEIDPTLDYCKGWEDFQGMGISVIGVYDYADSSFKHFLGDSLDKFQNLVNQREHIVGMNSISFDDRLCKANGVNIFTTYDLLCEVRIASGQPPTYIKGITRGGYNLDSLCQANLPISKSGRGDLAPMLWQRGEKQQVIDYCLRDVKLVKMLLDKYQELRDPTNGFELALRNPFETLTEITDNEVAIAQSQFSKGVS